MRNIILVVHISLDGFVAGPKGELDNFPSGEENLAFVVSLTQGADGALFGKNSYLLLNGYWPTARNHPGATKPEIEYSNWYNDARKIVVSTTLPQQHSDNTTIIRENVLSTITAIKKQPGKDILVFGSPALSRTLMEAGLIDEFWIFINPVLFGKGIPLFTGNVHLVYLKLLDVKLLPNGELAIHYVTKDTRSAK